MLHTEEIDLYALGKIVKVERATEVEFDLPSQEWQVRQGGVLLYSHPSRDNCLQWEQLHVVPT